MEPKPEVRELRKAGRITTKVHADEKKAIKDFDKAVAALPANLPPQRRSGAELDQQLFQLIAKLLAWGANRDPRGYTTIAWAADSADAGQIVRMLLTAGANPTDAGRSGYGALDSLARNSGYGALSAVEQLVAAGARCRPTAVASAAELGHARMIPLLLSAGGDLAAKVDGLTALDVAKKRKLARTVKALQP